MPDEPSALQDTYGRPLKNLRISVTDRCNLRCQYCMPEEEYLWLSRDSILTFEEISALVDVFIWLGVDKVRLTGGEPLLRKELPVLVDMLANKPKLRDLALTTNAVLLAEQADRLYRAGLHRITTSLDTLNPERFKALTRRDTHARVLAGIEAAVAAGFVGLKIDTVVMRGYNDDELVPLIEFGQRRNAEVRFIEYMDVGGATHWQMSRVLPRVEMLERLARHFGSIEPIVEVSSAPAQRYRLPDGTTFGIIASTTTPFCQSCDRSRLTADGMWYLCLYATEGTDLRRPLREGASAEELAEIITAGWTTRRDRGAEMRKALEHDGDRAALVQLETLRQNPHLEMHTRGG
jgi:cyclic pyranopterin phosphate synthase